MKKRNYKELYKKFQKCNQESGISLAKFCKTRRPSLSYNAVKVAFMRIKREQEKSNKKGENVTNVKQVRLDNTDKQKKRVKPVIKAKEAPKKGNKKVTKKLPNSARIFELELPSTKNVTIEVYENSEVKELIPLTIPEDDLNTQQRLFCENIVNGKMTPALAYQDIYNVKNNYVASACACRLLKNAKVAGYLNLLRCIKAANDQRRLGEINELTRLIAF